MVDHTPTAAVNAGDVLVVNNSLLVAHADIAASNRGALAAGGGVYDLQFGTNGSAISNENLVRWNATNNAALGGTVTTNLKFGMYIQNGTNTAASTNDATIRALHIAGMNL